MFFWSSWCSFWVHDVLFWVHDVLLEFMMFFLEFMMFFLSSWCSFGVHDVLLEFMMFLLSSWCSFSVHDALFSFYWTIPRFPRFITREWTRCTVNSITSQFNEHGEKISKWKSDLKVVEFLRRGFHIAVHLSFSLEPSRQLWPLGRKLTTTRTEYTITK